MPFYNFVNDETGEIREVFFRMNDVKEYSGGEGEEGTKWRRFFTVPNTSIDTRMNPFSAKDFVNKTAKAKTYGEMIDLSAEMSEARANKIGAADPQRVKAEKEYYNPNKKKK